MKHFIVEVVYKKPFDCFGDAVTRHRAYLEEGYRRGMILFSGPLVPRLGSVFVARAESAQELADFFEEDPYLTQGLAEFRFIQFDPTQYHAGLTGWFEDDN